MPDAIPACFRAAAAPGGRASASSGSGSGAGTSLATSVYDTRLGLAALSWSRAALGLSLRAVLRVSSAAPSPSAASDYGDGDGDGEVVEYEGECDGDGDEETVVAVRVRPWLLWRRRGSKRFRVRGGRRVVDVAWDLSRARFPPSGGSPEPSSGYFVAVVVDGEMAVVAGDMAEEAYRKTKARRPPGPPPALVSRREHVSMRDGGRGHRTCVVVRGKEREISVDLVSRAAAQGQQGREKDRERDRAEVGMSVSVDGDRVLHVRRLRWKFRGTEKVDLGGGDRVLVSWDLHNWLFPARDASPPDAAVAAAALTAAVAPPAHAVFVFRFELAGCDDGEERDPADDAKEKELLDKAGGVGVGGGGGWAGYVGRWGRGGDWSESSSNGEKRRRKRGQASRLAKASSSSSASVASSSASWASGSTVMDWGSPEEAELQSGDGFSLLVYAWKN
ncbi:uncharacterized protein LOC8054736 [Sorghum bicolor]|jgi:hypothetical protein|uniref:DUF868 domain-containing protein n=1 Tax=Sorghum bicolor TaxID=4558 RepID=A0A1B6QCI7_SORBI|nr:uncharacterized protein LOC8054736 [Sorghum bicolor]KXG35635.1 hypothetical protein SORBI_3002G202100 [Sorghum bicolor]|eukprot:XP_021308879.1 uncharacterized protein LOC8054736 [Sorghum bicolor]